MALVDAGADAVKVGIGPGSICTTRIVAGVGVPQITAVANVAAALAPHGVPLIADGGIRYLGRHRQGDRRRRALRDDRRPVRRHRGSARARSSCTRALRYKSYRGMGSLGAMAQAHGSRDRYFQDATAELEKLVPEGIEGRVPYKGSSSRSCTSSPAACAPRWATPAAPPSRRCARSPKFVRITSAGHAREPRARREDHQGSAELPCQLSSRPDAARPRRHPRAPDPDPRLRRAVHAADRAPRARARRLLRDPPLGRGRRRRSRAFGAARHHPLRRPGVGHAGRRAGRARRPCSSSACRCSASATACRRWPRSSAAASSPAPCTNSATPRCARAATRRCCATSRTASTPRATACSTSG